MGDIDDILGKDTVKDIIDQVADKVDQIDSLLVIVVYKNDEMGWDSNISRLSALSSLEIVKRDLIELTRGDRNSYGDT